MLKPLTSSLSYAKRQGFRGGRVRATQKGKASDERGELLGNQTFAQFGSGNLSNGLYYWLLKDSERIIKTGKVAIMK